MSRYISNSLVMVKPTYFCFNQETSVNNSFQNKPGITNQALQSIVMNEFDKMVTKIRSNGVNVIILESNFNTPDAVFPNNWFSTHLIDNQHYVFIYPMHTQNRRKEVQVKNLLSKLKNSIGYDYQVLDFRGDYSKSLESTGVLIFDHEYKIAYMSISPRADVSLAKKVCEKLGYELITFTSFDKKGPIYHTNVMFSVGEKLAIVCLESIKSNTEREIVKTSLQNTNKEIIDISLKQIYQMCGNVLEVKNKNNKNFLILSETAEKGFSKDQLDIIDKHVARVVCDVKNIENVGGGGVRCMLAEIFC